MQNYIPRKFWSFASIFLLTLIFFFLADFKFAEATIITSGTISSALNTLNNTETAATPVYIYIPSIKLLTHVQGVGIDKKGNMDVPPGKTNNVGWYQYGVTPGNIGTAVLDAHNTAAFKNLNSLPVGADIYIFTSRSEWLHFTVTDAKTYAVNKLSPSTLFASAQSPQINLITCAGKLFGNGEASHRLIVSAKLI